MRVIIYKKKSRVTVFEIRNQRNEYTERKSNLLERREKHLDPVLQVARKDSPQAGNTSVRFHYKTLLSMQAQIVYSLSQKTTSK